MLLAYADDIVILAESPHMLLRILRCLEEFCKINFLEVNEQKTQIVIFRKNGHKLSKKIPEFFYNNKKLQIVRNYCYLGVLFTNTGKFTDQLIKARTATNLAMSSIQGILCKVKGDHWSTKMRLFESL